MRRAQLFDGTPLDFPDETTDAVIEATVKRIMAERQQSQPQVQPAPQIPVEQVPDATLTLQRQAQAIPPEGAQGPTLEESGQVTPLIAGQRNEPVSPLVAGIDRGIASRLQGLAQLALEGLNKVGFVDDETLNKFNQKVQAEIDAFAPIDKEFVSARIGKFLGDFGLTSLIPGGATIKGAAAAGAALGATEFVPEGGDRLTNIGVGGGTGAGVSAGLKGITALGTRGINALRGRLDPESQAIQNLAQQQNIPITVGDITRGPLTQKAEVLGEQIPIIGLSGFRQTQQKSAAIATQDLLDGFSVNGDWAKIAQTSLNNKATKIRAASGKLFNKVNRLADPLGPVPVSRMNQVATKILDEEKRKAAFADDQLINAIEKYSTNPNANFSGLNSIRSDLADDIRDFFSGKNAIVGKKGVQKLQQIKNALDEDMNSFAQGHGGQIKIAWDRANTFFKERVVPFKDSAIAKAAKSDTPDEIYKAFITRNQRGGGGRDRAQKFFNALDKRGQDAVRFGMLEDAMTAAKGERGIFSPARFAQSLEGIEEAAGVFFRGADKAKLRGFTKLMRHIERAGQFAENPPTGQRLMIPALGVGAIISFPAAAGIAGISLAIKTLFGTEAGKRILLSANQTGSKGLDRLIDQATGLISRGAAISAVDSDEPIGSQAGNL